MQDAAASKAKIGSFTETQLYKFAGRAALSYYLLNYSAPTAIPCDAAFRSCPEIYDHGSSKHFVLFTLRDHGWQGTTAPCVHKTLVGKTAGAASCRPSDKSCSRCNIMSQEKVAPRKHHHLFEVSLDFSL